MRIYYQSKDRKLPIRMAIPTIVVGWRWVWRLIGAASSNNLSFITGDVPRQLAAALRGYVRANGHFDLLDMALAQGERVRIRV